MMVKRKEMSAEVQVVSDLLADRLGLLPKVAIDMLDAESKRVALWRMRISGVGKLNLETSRSYRLLHVVPLEDLYSVDLDADAIRALESYYEARVHVLWEECNSLLNRLDGSAGVETSGSCEESE